MRVLRLPWKRRRCCVSLLVPDTHWWLLCRRVYRTVLTAVSLMPEEGLCLFFQQLLCADDSLSTPLTGAVLCVVNVLCV